MIDYHKELSYFKNADSTHIRCDIDLVESAEKVVQLFPEGGIAVSHDILFSNYLVPLDLCQGFVNTVDLTIRLPSLQNLANKSDTWIHLECSLRSIFSSLSNVRLKELYLKILAPSGIAYGEKKRRLLPDITSQICLGGLHLYNARKIVMRFPNLPRQAFVFESIIAPKLLTLETNFISPCTEKQCKLFHSVHGKPMMNQCFASFLDENSGNYIVQGFHFDPTVTGGAGIMYEMEEEEHPIGGLFRISPIHFPEIIKCDVLKRIIVHCGNDYLCEKRAWMDPGWTQM